eukprot:CAMPEP_0201735224 /NCGR_PEP_ID=MMETSP0593-20130828/36497_1 /ASSEMBLY_ACC=CAM_ASM_000672 /TAXON_ID=267983 /ORGANISM="Skeletonema japonicum, Strain CCMP2506" /LENGTH=101 /DNA_ID=CAMNT_0048228735 /DNA_START=1 /DNA_END=302 /DNA_ORIENTATION=-
MNRKAASVGEDDEKETKPPAMKDPDNEKKSPAMKDPTEETLHSCRPEVAEKIITYMKAREAMAVAHKNMLAEMSKLPSFQKEHTPTEQQCPTPISTAVKPP